MKKTLQFRLNNVISDQINDWKLKKYFLNRLEKSRFMIISGFLCTLMIFCISTGIFAQQQLENLSRGIVAVKTGDNSAFISWRLLATDPDTVGFNVYRDNTKLNDTPVITSTNFVDEAYADGAKYHVISVLGGIETESSDTVTVWAQNYLTIPLNRPAGGTTPPYTVTNNNITESYPNGQDYTYSPNDCSLGDLDGDGEYELIVKWEPSNARDNSHGGITGYVILDAYKYDGTHLWRINLEKNIRAGAHYTQFMVYDLDGDGKAEVACKTAPGTKDGTGNYLKLGPAATADHTADYRNSYGYVLSGPEYFTIFDGETGTELATTEYLPPRGSVSAWGDSYGNRVDRFLACIAYLDGTRPSVVMCRGYYTRTVLAAWDWREGQLTHRWTFDSDNGYPSFAGQGNHNLSVADVDGDGKDEIVYGSMAVDDNGTGLWTTGLSHGDAMHLSDLDPDRPGLEVWGIHEGSETPGSALLDACTGEVIWKTPNADVGRGVAADLDSLQLGMECWGGTDGLRSAKNQKVGNAPGSSNHVIWWDGDLLRELLNDTYIDKYGQGLLFNATGCASINGTKSNPNLQGDLFGDWREEVIFRTTDNTALRIYTTTIPTNYRITTLMHDHVYRMGIAWQNVAYNQPPHTGFYLGYDMFVADSLRPPSAPMGLKALALNDTVKLTWNSNLEPDLAGYNVYRSKNQQGPFEKINIELLLETSFVDSVVMNDSTYYYTISALDTLANESRRSVVNKAIPTIRPDIPFGIYSRNDVGKIKLFWNADVTGAVIGYNVYRSDTTGEDFQLLNPGLIEGTSYLDSMLTDDKTYYYIIRSVDTVMMESFDSPEIIVTAGPVTYLQAEEGIVSNLSIDNNHLGFNGTGFLNFGSNNSYVEFTHIGGYLGGDYMLVYRYALGTAGRTGALIVNGISQNLTMKTTSAWTNYVYDSVRISLNAGFTNTIRIAATGADFGNLDEIMVKPALPTSVDTYYGTELSVISNIYPNPFSDRLTIEYTNAMPGNITVQVFNSLGKVVKTLEDNYQAAGTHTISWDATDNAGYKLTEGLYFCRLTVNNNAGQVKKIILMNGN